MISTYQEALKKFGSRYHIRKALAEERLFRISRNQYSNSESYDSLYAIIKRYPSAIVTGLTAFYIHGLTDVTPQRIDLATKRAGTKIASSQVTQHFIPEEWLELGKTTIIYDGTTVPIYDLERMLLELMRNRNKSPYDVFREIIAAYRTRAESIDIYRLEDYARIMPRGKALLSLIMKEVF